MFLPAETRDHVVVLYAFCRTVDDLADAPPTGTTAADQDGDGVDYPTDCNDTDPTITGPVAESINGIDDDCNGYVDDFAVGAIKTGMLLNRPLIEATAAALTGVAPPTLIDPVMVSGSAKMTSPGVETQ